MRLQLHQNVGNVQRERKKENLVSSAYKIKLVFLQELGDFVCPEGEGNSPIIFTPSLDIPIRIRPKKVTQESLVRHINRPFNGSDLIQTL